MQNTLCTTAIDNTV